MGLNLCTGLTPDNSIKHIMFVVKGLGDKTVFITATTSLHCVQCYRTVEDGKLGSGCLKTLKFATQLFDNNRYSKLTRRQCNNVLVKVK